MLQFTGDSPSARKPGKEHSSQVTTAPFPIRNVKLAIQFLLTLDAESLRYQKELILKVKAAIACQTNYSIELQKGTLAAYLVLTSFSSEKCLHFQTAKKPAS